MTANAHSILGDDSNVLKRLMVMAAKPCEYRKNTDLYPLDELNGM